MTASDRIAWKVRAITAILIGVVFGLVVSIYGALHIGANGLASAGCNGTGCAEALAASDRHYDIIVAIGMLGGGGLALAGMIALVALRRIATREPSLPVAIDRSSPR